MTVTLTQVLALRDELCLYGQFVSDFYLRGDLGLGLDPRGAVGFARVHAYQLPGGLRQALPEPLLLSVHGAGIPAAPEVVSGERCWRVYRDDGAVRVVPARRSYGAWLGLESGDAA